MRKVREVLRLKYESGRSHAEIAASVGIGESTVGDYLARARRVGLAWETARELGEVELESKLFRDGGRNEPPARVPVDFAWVHRELARPSVTLQTVWVEYREAAAGQRPLLPYEYSRFCDLYARWKKTLGVVMRQVHRAGEKVFIDYSGKKPRIVDRETGEVTEVELFVAVLGASNYTFAEATRSQKLADFVGSTIRAFEYFGAVPQVVVPDYVPRHVIGVMCPAPLRGRRARDPRTGRGASLAGAHNGQRAASQASSASSFRQTAFRGSAAEAVIGGSHAAKAASFARMLISA